MSGEEDRGGEKTHEPTPKRLEDARRKGDVAKSAEIGVAASYLALLAALVALGGPAFREAGGALMIFLDQPDRLTGRVLGPGGGRLSAALAGEVAAALAPIFLLPLAAALLAYVAQNAVVFSLEKLAPKASRVSPVAVAKQKFGPPGLVEFAKSAVKLLAISAICGALLWGQIDEIVGAARATPAAVALLMGRLFLQMMIGILIVAALIAAVDAAWQRHEHRQRLRMSTQDIRDEQKETEGDPQLKRRRRQRAVDVATSRALADVPTADVVIVNPVHVSVALRWSRAKGSAPVCVAKGVDEIAHRIRELAEAHGVPIHRDAASARALNAVVGIGEEIPPEHYRAVAAAIRFAEDMRRRARARGAAAPGDGA